MSDGPSLRVLRLLAVLARQHATAGDLAARAGVPISTTYRLLGLLVEEGFAHKRPDGLYAAGPVAIQLAERYRESTLVDSAVTAALRELSVASGELSAFMVARDGEALCVETAPGRGVLQCCYTIGATRPLLKGATATALLSTFAPEDRARVYDRYGLSASARTRVELDCAEAASVGYAVSEGQLDPDIWGASSPVLDAKGTLFGAVTLMAPAWRVRDGGARYITLVRRTAHSLSGGIQ